MIFLEILGGALLFGIMEFTDKQITDYIQII